MLAIADPNFIGQIRQLRGTGVQVVALIYGEEYGPKPPKVALASDRSYMDQLESAGAIVRMAEKGGETL
jgi:hypothetical protein